jgi:Putative adhesin
MPGPMSRLTDRAITQSDRAAGWGARVLRSRGMRRAWLVLASVAGVLALVGGTVQAAAVFAHEERTETTEVAAAGLGGLVVDNSAGSITVVGVSDADAVTVTARISEGLRDTGHVVAERDGMLFVTGSCPVIASEWCDVDYTIEVPSGLHVDLGSEAGVTVSDVDGGVVAHSDQGAVELARVGGDVDISSDQGRLEATDLTADRLTGDADQGRVRLEFAESPRAVDVEADQGRVEIVLPDDDDVVYATTTHADQGTVSDSIRQDPDSDRSIRVDADQGNITLTYAAS